MFQNFIRYFRIYFTVAILLTFLAVIIIGINAYHGFKVTEEQDLFNRAETIVRLLEPREVTFLRGDESDIKNPFYISLKNRFVMIKEANPDIQVIYLSGKNNDNVFVYLDSSKLNDSEYSFSIQSSAETNKNIKNVFETGLSIFSGPINEPSGEFISVFVPLRHSGTEKIVAVLAMKVSASSYFLNMMLSVLTPTLIIALLFIILSATLLAYKKEREDILFKEDLISIVSHDLRSPITGLSWSIQSLLMNKDFSQYPENIKSTLVAMDKTVRGLLAIVADILNISQLGKISVFNMQNPVDLCSIISESIELLTFFAKEKEVQIQKDGEWPEKAMTVGNEEKFKRAISNIIGNGVQYSPHGEIVHINYHKENKQHIVSVENHGTLIPQSAQIKIFTKFFRANNTTTLSQPGTGLGLYFAKQIIEAYGGKVWFKSEGKDKTIFNIALPATITLQSKNEKK
jgi:signal transduction histidine kinase